MAKRINWLELGAVTAVSLAISIYCHFKFGSLWLEVAGFVTGAIGVYLAAREHIVNWAVAIVNVILYAILFYQWNLMGDASLQVFYLALSIHGWLLWARIIRPRGVESNSKELPVTKLKQIHWAWISAIIVIGTIAYFPILALIRRFNPATESHYTLTFGSLQPMVDHFRHYKFFYDTSLTVASVVAQVLQNKKILETWWMWIVLDALFVPLYISQELFPTAILYAFFTGLAVVGLLDWQRKVKTTQTS